MKRLRNVEKLLVFFFAFVPFLSSKAKKLIVVLRLYQVVGARVVITSLYRHILYALEIRPFSLFSFNIRDKKRWRQKFEKDELALKFKELFML